MIGRISRRVLLGVIGATGLGRRTWAAVATPEQTTGPFYPPPADRPADEDWDLVKIEGEVREAGGEVLHLSGRVLDRDGAPVPDALIEIWQCDANGRYLHHGDNRAVPRDAAFQGYGAVWSAPDGGYRFRTIRPVAYPGRTPHIHARITSAGGALLTTQIYVAGEPSNQRDFIFRSLGRSGQEAASMTLAPRGDGTLETTFDFVV